MEHFQATNIFGFVKNNVYSFPNGNYDHAST